MQARSYLLVISSFQFLSASVFLSRTLPMILSPTMLFLHTKKAIRIIMNNSVGSIYHLKNP